MQNQTTNPYDDVHFQTSLSLEECLQRLEDYHNKKPGLLDAKKSLISIRPIKVSEIYEVEAMLNEATLKARLQADGDKCLIHGKVHYDWSGAITVALVLFALVWMGSGFTLSLGNILLFLVLFVGGSFTISWFSAVGSGETVKQRFIELLREEQPSQA